MPASCLVRGCLNAQESHPVDVTFHKFPLDKPQVLEKWVRAVNRKEKVSKLDVLCSDHFAPECFMKRFGRQCLRPNMYPTRKLLQAKSTGKGRGRKSADATNSNYDEDDDDDEPVVVDILETKEAEMVMRSGVPASRKRKGGVVADGPKRLGRPRKDEKRAKMTGRAPSARGGKRKVDDDLSSPSHVVIHKIGPTPSDASVLKLRDRIVALESENKRLVSEYKQEQTKNKQLEEKLDKLHAPLKAYPRIVITRIQF